MDKLKIKVGALIFTAPYPPPLVKTLRTEIKKLGKDFESMKPFFVAVTVLSLPRSQPVQTNVNEMNFILEK